MAGQGESMTSERMLSAVDKQRRALELRKAGYGFQAIADQVGYRSTASAYDAVKSALKKTLQEPADEYRELQRERLEQLWRTIYPQMIKGNFGAIDRGVKILQEMAELQGLNMAKDANLNVSLTDVIRIIGVAPEDI